jgi:acetolactate synthase-1/2/3 large subunit
MNESLNSICAKPRQVGFQETPVQDMFSSCTKYSKKIMDKSDVYSIFSEALNSMMNDRLGPVLIDFPVNIQMEKIFDPFILNIKTNDRQYSDTTNINININNIITSTKRPLIILGNGARYNNNSLIEWINHTNIPFVTSWAAIDLIDHIHPLRIGSIGVYGDRLANFCVQNADLLIILGSRMDTRQTGGNPQLCSMSSTKIMVDIDEEEIKKLNERGFKIDIPIISTVKQFIERIKVKALCDEWKNIISIWKDNFGIESTRKGDIYKIMNDIQFPGNSIIICDTGATLVWAMQSINIKQGQRLFSNLGNSSMGYALPAAIGAAIATNNSVPIISISGDGGIQMNIQELITVSSLNLPITIIIVNNSGYGIIRQFQDSYFKSRYTATNSQDLFKTDNGIDFIHIGEAYNIKSIRTTSNIEISINNPVLYDIPIDPNQKIYPKLEFGNSLENMAPHLPDLHKYMLVEQIPPIIQSGWVTK